MSGFAKASSAFREHAIKVLGTKDVSGGPNAEVIKMEATVGKAWAFFAAPSATPQKQYRGWATGDGKVITTEQNFGVLLEEAGVWAKPQGDLSKLPAAVAWALGNGYSDGGDPELKLGADGAGTVTIPLEYQQAGGGGSLGPREKMELVATVAKDHTATTKLAKR